MEYRYGMVCYGWKDLGIAVLGQPFYCFLCLSSFEIVQLCFSLRINQSPN